VRAMLIVPRGFDEYAANQGVPGAGDGATAMLLPGDRTRRSV
jgi:hypothetical protein